MVIAGMLLFYNLLIYYTVMSECDEDFCQNGGTCIKHVLTVMCECPSGFIGYFCQEKGL